MRIDAAGELLASAGDVWALLAEPHHLSDWWPGYTAIRPDRRGLVEGARWGVVRSHDPGLLRRPGGDGLIVVSLVDPGRALAWRDQEQGFTARIELTSGATTAAVISLDAPWWRIAAEGLRPLPRRALARLRALCQTAATL